ncbi:MAG: UDP-3-O-[3-hydroxymyristoyl] N-acetylglucosamine deacetylase [Phycisphaerae bacterium]|nr:UDP-3-O-[3-hydroxymyristoyl] N-acetylglucosamine deacetylase [Phycisphaerae bacterium]
MPVTSQKTVRRPVVVEGRGLFGGRLCRLRIVPAEADAGLVFVRTDLDGAPRVACDINRLTRSETRRTVLAAGEATVETVEHVLSAVWGLGVDNACIEMNAPEPPSDDGSARLFTDAIGEVGLEEQAAERVVEVVEEPVTVSSGEATLSALPGVEGQLDLLYDLDYAGVPSIGRQVRAFALDRDDYAGQIAPARTFLLADEAAAFRSQGYGGHLDATQLLVMDDEGPVDNELRFSDEHVRHKLCDLIGDLALLGRRLEGRILASRSGHRMNHELVRRLREASGGGESSADRAEPVLDIRGVMRLLPHRYPFLMVDRIVETEGDERAVGIKNVTINEPYFQGHYPGQPIMPGVMILEAMAQMSGILLSRRLEHAGKVAVLLSMDRVKMRRPVHPGDRMYLEAEAVRVRPRTGHCACRARVDGDVVAEAEIKFMLVDAEPA